MTTWFGWLCDTRRQLWEKVCEVEGLPACSRRLGEIVRQRGTKEKYATMTGGAAPTFRPAGRRPSVAPEPTNDAEGAGPSGKYLEGR